jgi:hypothetical protein
LISEGKNGGQVGDFEILPNCDFKMADGSQCPVPATHFWGSVKMCCTHFEQFATGVLNTTRLPEKPRHIDIVEEWNLQCERTSLIPGAKCESND